MSIAGEIGEKVTHTYCQICEQYCGLKVTARNNRIVSILPDTENPAKWRDFCIKGRYSAETVTHPNRIVQPMRRVGERYVPARYEDAIDDIATRLTAIIAQHGPESLGMYTGSTNGDTSMFLGAILDAVGSHNRFWVGSIDQNAWHYVCEHVFGSAWLSLIPDVDACDCFLFVGSNPAISDLNWVGHVHDGWRRVLKRVAAGADLIVVDPRRSETAQKATLHLAPLPEQDWALLLCMITIIFRRGWERPHGVDVMRGLDELKDLTRHLDPAALALRCGCALDSIEDAARRFSHAHTACCFPATGVGQGRNGALGVWLAMALSLITGRIDVPGGRFMPSWPINLAAAGESMFPPSRRKSRVRGLQAIAGAQAVAEIPDEIETPGPGQIRAFFMACGNPVTSGPDGARLDAALAKLDLLVGVDLFQRESHRHAHWLIPGVHFLERTTLSPLLAAITDIPYIQMQRAAVPRPDTVRDEWEFVSDLAKAMGLTLFGGRVPDPTPEKMARNLLAAGGQVTYDDVVAAEHGLVFAERSMGHFWENVRKTGKKADVCPASLLDFLHSRLAEPIQRTDEADYPYQLISRRRKAMMNSWMVETSGTKVPDPTADSVELNIDDAVRLGVSSGDDVRIRSRAGSLTVRAVVSEDIRPGVVVMAQGWGGGVYDPASGRVASRHGVTRNLLVSSADVDPLTGVPRFNGTPVAVDRV